MAKKRLTAKDWLLAALGLLLVSAFFAMLVSLLTSTSPRMAQLSSWLVCPGGRVIVESSSTDVYPGRTVTSYDFSCSSSGKISDGAMMLAGTVTFTPAIAIILLLAIVSWNASSRKGLWGILASGYLVLLLGGFIFLIAYRPMSAFTAHGPLLAGVLAVIVIALVGYKAFAPGKKGKDVPQKTSPPRPYTAATTEQPGVSDRLAELEKLRSQNLVTEKEYRKKRQQILSEL